MSIALIPNLIWGLGSLAGLGLLWVFGLAGLVGFGRVDSGSRRAEVDRTG